jgi:hypothetical protein
MNKNNSCKLFLGSVLIAMLLGGAARLMNNRMDAEVAKSESITTVAENVPEPVETNDDGYTAINEINEYLLARV